MIRSFILAIPLALLALLIGCDRQGSSNQAASKPARGPSTVAAAPAPLAEVRSGYFPNFTHAQAVLGVASGEFQQAVGSTKVSTKVFNAGPSLIEALFGNQIDIGYVGPGPALNAFG